jgi:hypothetical protein
MKSCKVRLEQITDPENLREAFLRAARRETILRQLFSGTGHRAPTATGTSPTTATTTSASASPSVQSDRV